MEVENPVLDHLRLKTRALARLREHTRAFAQEVSQTFSVDKLASFELRRERLIKVISLHDQRVAVGIVHLSLEERTDPEFLQAVREEVGRHEAEIHGVLGDDEGILEAVRSAQVDLAREISKNSRQGQELARFKSEWVGRSGEGIDSHA